MFKKSNDSMIGPSAENATLVPLSEELRAAIDIAQALLNQRELLISAISEVESEKKTALGSIESMRQAICDNPSDEAAGSSRVLVERRAHVETLELRLTGFRRKLEVNLSELEQAASRLKIAHYAWAFEVRGQFEKSYLEAVQQFKSVCDKGLALSAALGDQLLGEMILRNQAHFPGKDTNLIVLVSGEWYEQPGQGRRFRETPSWMEDPESMKLHKSHQQAFTLLQALGRTK